jgi:hypothetical protein
MSCFSALGEGLNYYWNVEGSTKDYIVLILKEKRGNQRQRFRIWPAGLGAEPDAGTGRSSDREEPVRT